MEPWDDTHGITHLRRVRVEPPINITDTLRSAIVDPLVGGDSQLTTSGKQHSQRAPAAEHQDQPRQWAPTADTSYKARRSSDQAHSMGYVPTMKPNSTRSCPTSAVNNNEEGPKSMSDPAPRESDPEYFNIINVYAPVTHSTTGTVNHFWSIVGGQHDTDMINTLDSLTLRTTATTLAWNHSEHNNASEFSKTFNSIEQATNWQNKMHASLRDTGWRLQAFTRAPELEVSGWCWTRPRSKAQNSDDSTNQTGTAHPSQPEFERDYNSAQHDEASCPSLIDSTSSDDDDDQSCPSLIDSTISDDDDDHSPELDVENDSDLQTHDEKSCPSLVSSDDDDESDDDELPPLVRLSQSYDSVGRKVPTATHCSSDNDPSPPNRGEYDAAGFPPPNRGEYEVAGFPPHNRGGHDASELTTSHRGGKCSSSTHIRNIAVQTPDQDKASEVTCNNGQHSDALTNSQLMPSAPILTRVNDEPDKERLAEPRYCHERVRKGLKQNHGPSFTKACSPYPASDCSSDSGDGEPPHLIDHSSNRDVPSPTRGVHDAATHATAPNRNTATLGFDPCHVIWDCAASSNICSNVEIATDVKPCRPMTMAGIVPGTKVVYTQNCNLIDPAFGRWTLAMGSTANILSQSVAIDAGFQVKYENDTFIVSHPTRTDTRYVFGRVIGTRGNTKHYLMDYRTMMPPVSARTNTHILMGYEPGEHTIKRQTESVPLRTTSGLQVRAGNSHDVGQHGGPEHIIKRAIMPTFSVIAKSAHEKCHVAIGYIPGAFPHVHMKTDVEKAFLTVEPDVSPHLNTKSYTKTSKPKGGHRATITFVVSNSIGKVKRADFRP